MSASTLWGHTCSQLKKYGIVLCTLPAASRPSGPRNSFRQSRQLQRPQRCKAEQTAESNSQQAALQTSREKTPKGGKFGDRVEDDARYNR